MILWVIVAVVCCLLNFAPIIIFNIVVNLFDVLFKLWAAFCRWGFHEIVTISRVAWTILTLPDRLQMPISGGARHFDDTSTPNEISQTGDLIDYTVKPDVTSSVDGPGCGLEQRCGGKTATGARCKRAKMASTDQADRWYCKDHIKQRRGE